MAGIIYNAVWAVIHFFFRIIEKALSCVTGLKRTPCDSVNLSEIGIVSNKDKPADLITWSSWDDIPIIVTHSGPKPVDSVQLKIEEYRERKMALQIETDPEKGIDFFEDMAPKITKQEKILVQGVEADECFPETSSSLTDDSNFPSPELGEWEESGQWEDHSPNDWSPFEMLRDTKKIEKNKRVPEQQKKKQGKDPLPRRSSGITK